MRLLPLIFISLFSLNTFANCIGPAEAALLAKNAIDARYGNDDDNGDYYEYLLNSVPGMALTADKSQYAYNYEFSQGPKICTAELQVSCDGLKTHASMSCSTPH